MTDGLAEKARFAKHFDESKTSLKVKRGFNIDKSGRYSLQDVFRLHEIINAKAAEMDKVAEDMRNFRTEIGRKEKAKKFDENNNPVDSTENILDNLMSGLSAEVQNELDLNPP